MNRGNEMKHQETADQAEPVTRTATLSASAPPSEWTDSSDEPGCTPVITFLAESPADAFAVGWIAGYAAAVDALSNADIPKPPPYKPPTPEELGQRFRRQP